MPACLGTVGVGTVLYSEQQTEWMLSAEAQLTFDVKMGFRKWRACCLAGSGFFLNHCIYGSVFVSYLWFPLHLSLIHATPCPFLLLFSDSSCNRLFVPLPLCALQPSSLLLFVSIISCSFGQILLNSSLYTPPLSSFLRGTSSLVSSSICLCDRDLLFSVGSSLWKELPLLPVPISFQQVQSGCGSLAQGGCRHMKAVVHILFLF